MGYALTYNVSHVILAFVWQHFIFIFLGSFKKISISSNLLISPSLCFFLPALLSSSWSSSLSPGWLATTPGWHKAAATIIILFIFHCSCSRFVQMRFERRESLLSIIITQEYALFPGRICFFALIPILNAEHIDYPYAFSFLLNTSPSFLFFTGFLIVLFLWCVYIYGLFHK